MGACTIGSGKAAITMIAGARAPGLPETRYAQAQHEDGKQRFRFEPRAMPGSKHALRAQAVSGAVQSEPRDVARLRCPRRLEFQTAQQLRMRTQARRGQERCGDCALPRGPSCAHSQPPSSARAYCRNFLSRNRCRQASRRCRVWTFRR